MTYAFTFDASACSGCKACQAACKDKNQLPLGVLWRRVYEVSGGGWEKQGNAWTNTVFAYNLSVACNHCEHPKCAGVCPVDAYVVRPDGIVYIDESKCVGCGYCVWACPYGAPQYNHELGHMTKCNFCFDNIDMGNPPACVAACPLRVLNFVTIDDGQWADDAQSSAVYRPLWKLPASEHPFPMYPLSRTEPHLAVKPHAAMNLSAEKKLANVEEIRPRRESAWEEFPLIIFTLLAQLSVGAFWSMLLMSPKPLTILPLSIIGAALAIGMFSSFAHMGTKKNAWRVLNHLRKSWLSREILSASLFGAGWLAVTAEVFIFKRSTPLLLWFTALFGFLLVYSMANVYLLRSKPAWNTWRTTASFFTSAILLGTAFMLSVSAVMDIKFQWQAASATLMLAALQWVITSKWQARNLQSGLSVLAMFAIVVFIFLGPINLWGNLSVFLLVLAAEVVGRWRFYEAQALP